MKNIWSVSFILFLLTGCNGIHSLRLEKVPPYEKYIRSLKQAELDKTVMAQLWIEAGKNALQDSVLISLPFSESGYFTVATPAARSYRFNVRKGQVLTIDGVVTAKKNGRVFLELFGLDKNNWKPLADVDSTLQLTHEFENDQHVLIRLQPELLVGVYYTISLSVTPVLLNPVAGATNKSIGSFYGDSRDGGKRKHEGIDIFAKKGTPVIAPTDGYIARVATTGLGGKVIWMQDKKRGHSYYFAHLDKQLVKGGTHVTKGDTLGTVGNTGNARTTPSHLHFGIYQSNSLDPVHFVKTLDNSFQELPWDTAFRQPDFKVVRSSNLYSGPEEKLSLTSLLKDTYVHVVAQSRDWYRVVLPNSQQGFVQKSKIAPISKGKRIRVKHVTQLLSDIETEAVPKAHLLPNTPVEILARFEKFSYVRTREGIFGWLIM